VQKVKPALLRGFDQEYLPQDQLQFNRLIDIIRRNFELYGFLPIETPSAERREVLTSKGGVEKEIYALTRLAEADDDEAATKGALRFDLTVPLARYVAMRERELAFPFRRYQIQRVWRGETPQANKGRFREFYQCDIDIIGREKLSYLAEAEIPSVIYSVFREMAIGEFRIRINNRKVLRGILQEFGVPDDKAAAVLRTLDKAEKEDAGKLRGDLEREGVAAAGKLLDLITTRRTTDETLNTLSFLKGEIGKAGLEELRNIVVAIRQFGVPDTAFAVDLGVVRGLDYYTGTIYETTLTAHPDIGSICSGGRYDDLASYFTETQLPGVGISIGLTRLFFQLREAGVVSAAGSSVDVLVALLDDASLDQALAISPRLRGAGLNVETQLEPRKLARQLQYADRAGIRFVVMRGEDEASRGVLSIKDLHRGEQQEVPEAGLIEALRAMHGQPSQAVAEQA